MGGLRFLVRGDCRRGGVRDYQARGFGSRSLFDYEIFELDFHHFNLSQSLLHHLGLHAHARRDQWAQGYKTPHFPQAK